MSSIELTHILGNLSQSLLPVQSLVSGLGYLIGIAFVIGGLVKLTKVNKHSREHIAGPTCLILGGAVLIYLPSSLVIMSDTLFGSGNALQYTQYNPYNIYSSVKVLIQTAGLIWFVRGTVLLVHAAEPGKQHGHKGFMFLIAGICAMNFDYSVQALNMLITYIMELTVNVH